MKLAKRTTEEIRKAEFDQLSEIVCRHFRVSVEDTLSGNRQLVFTRPRNVIGSLWSNWATLADAAARCGWKSPQCASGARKAVEKLQCDGKFGRVLAACMDEVEEQLPHLL